MAAKKKTETQTEKSTSATGGSPAMDLIVAALKENKNVVYADVKAAADKKGLTIFPIMFGRAKLLLGHVKAKPREAGKRGLGRPPKIAGRRSGRPRKAAARRDRPSSLNGPMAALQDLISNLEGHARENARMRETLEEIARMIERVGRVAERRISARVIGQG